MRKEYFVCDLCGRSSDGDVEVLGITILALEYPSGVGLYPEPDLAHHHHICANCLESLERHFTTEDIKN